MFWITMALASGTVPTDCPAREVPVEGLDGVMVRFPAQPCVFEVGAEPTPIRWEIVVERPLGKIESTPHHCSSFDGSGFVLRPTVRQGPLLYDPWDHGECATTEQTKSSPEAGTTPGTFSWSPHAWSGPSCTGEPYGTAFVAGPAAFQLAFSGTRRGKPFSVMATWPIALR